jgi:abortive infection bacteriophage resistance protein
MRKRGLSVADEAECEHALRFVGYYRLSAYMLPFQNGGSASNRHDFKPGTDFKKILDLYTFDRQLRLVAIDALERIEVALRTAITDAMCTSYDPFWFLNRARFSSSFNFDEGMENLKQEIGYYKADKRSIAISHYYNSYDQPYLPPSWMIFEALSFGSVVHIFRRLSTSDRKKISNRFNIDEKIASSWFFSLSYARNLCAHHQRFWNRIFTIKPAVQKSYHDDLSPNETAYAQFVTMQVLMRVISPTSRWQDRLNGVVTSYPSIQISELGFPIGWDARPLWK